MTDEIEAAVGAARAELAAQSRFPRRSPEHVVLRALCRGVRQQAARERVPPLNSEMRWPAFGGWLALLHSGEELVLEVARDAGVRLRLLAGHAVLVPPSERGMKVPSRAAALLLADLVRVHCGVLPSTRAIRRAMALLDHRARAPQRTSAA